MPIRILGLVTLAACQTTAFAQSEVSPAWIGTYTVKSSRQVPSGNAAPAPQAAHLSDKAWSMDKADRTNKLVDKVGTAFGVEYDRNALNLGSLRTVFLLPAPGLLDKGTGKYSTRIEYRTPCPTTCQSIYIYEEESEILAGVTRVELWQGSRLLDTQEFTVTK